MGNTDPTGDHMIALNFRDDRCRGDGGGQRVSVNDRKLRKITVDADGVGQEIVRCRRELLHRVQYRQA